MRKSILVKRQIPWGGEIKKAYDQVSNGFKTKARRQSFMMD